MSKRPTRLVPRLTKSFKGCEQMTQQQFKEDCDVNNIMERYFRTGVLDHIAQNEPQYGMMDGKTFTELQNEIAAAKSLFESLPARARAHFEHEVTQFLDYVASEDASESLLRDLGVPGDWDPSGTPASEIGPGGLPTPSELEEISTNTAQADEALSPSE